MIPPQLLTALLALPLTAVGTPTALAGASPSFVALAAAGYAAAGCGVSEAGADGDIHEKARQLADAGDHAGAVAILTTYLKRTAEDPLAHELEGLYLLELDRDDEAAHHLQISINQYEALGDTRSAKRLGRSLSRADKLTARRIGMFNNTARELFKAAKKLNDNGQTDRAYEVLLRIQPLAKGKELGKIEELLGELEAARSEVDLDAAGSDEGAVAERELIRIESEHYFVEARLEPEVVQLVADTMDDIYGYYVQIYFDGKPRKAAKATIHIEPTWQQMADLYPGGAASPGLGGWWSPSENQVTCYDTRDRTGDLDRMLDTLFHEASHQFMTILARGTRVPSWFNEGTSSFFEGAVAMADRRVLWPDAALSRLSSLKYQLGAGKVDVADVIGYEGAGSYQGDYYAFGWGLVYFLQQWQDPATLEYSYRPLYSLYRDEILTGKRRSRELFDEVFIGKNSPLGHETFADFKRDWRSWIEDTIHPLHFGTPDDVRERRWTLAQEFIKSANAAKEERKPRIPEQELLMRAMGHLEYIRSHITLDPEHAREVLLTQVDVLERMERPRAAAPVLEQLLEMVDAGKLAMEEEEYTTLDERLALLDKGNYALRDLRSRTSRLKRAALSLVEAYAKTKKNPRVLRAYTFAARMREALHDDDELALKADELRLLARDQGLLAGSVFAVDGGRKDWKTIFTAPPRSFQVSADEVRLRAVEPVALVDTSHPLTGEFELRARLSYTGGLHMGSAYGVVIAGTMEGEWAMAGIDSKGNFRTWKVLRSGTGVRTKPYKTVYLEEPVAEDETVDLVLHVHPDRRVIMVTVGDREPFEAKLPIKMPDESFVGIFARDTTAVLDSLVVEIYP